MKRFTGVYLDALGNPKPNATVKVCPTGTTALAGLSLNGNSITNPLTTDAYGRFIFEVTSGVYDLLDSSNQVIQSKVQVFDFENPNEWLSAKKIPVSAIASPYTNVGDAIEALVAETVPSGSFSTPPTGVTVLGEKNSRIYTKKWRITYSAFSAISALAGGVLLGTLPARIRIQGAILELTTPPVGTSMTSFLPSLGSVVNTPGNVQQQLGTQLGNLVGQSANSLYSFGFSAQPFTNVNTAPSLYFNAVAVGANLSALTAFQADLTFMYIVLP